MRHVRLDLAIAEKAQNGTLAEICEAHGLPAKYAADLSRIRRGLSVTAEKYRRIGRALGLVDPPRNPPRWTVAPELDTRARATGRSRREIIEAGIKAVEARNDD